MKKIFTAIATIIVTRFIIKAVDRITHPEELRKEYEKADRYRKKLEADRMRRAEPKDLCDGAALRPCSDMGLRAWGGECNGSAMGVAR